MINPKRNYSIRRIWWPVAFLLTLMIAFGVQAGGPADTAAIELQTSSSNIAIGDQFAVDMLCAKLDGGSKVQAAFSCFADIAFDQSILQVVGVNYNAPYTSAPQLRGTFDNSTGTISAVGEVAGITPPSLNTPVAQIVFRAVGPGNVTLDASTVAGSNPFAEVTVYGSDGDQRATTSVSDLSLEIAPSPVQLLSPRGTIPQGDVLSVTFEAQAGTTAHTFKVDSTLGNIVPETEIDTTACAGSLCQQTVPSPAGNFPLGDYTIEITPKAGTLAGPKTVNAFTVGALGMQRVSLIEPKDVIPPSNTLNIRFEAQHGTTAHEIGVISYATGLVSGELVDTSDCAGQICQYTVPNYTGTLGLYDVWIQPRAGAVAGAYAVSQFEVANINLNPMALNAPQGTIPASNTLMVEFDAQAGTTAHEISIFNVSTGSTVILGQSYDTSDCAGGVCQLSIPYNGALGTYHFWSQPKAGNVAGPYNLSTFEVGNVSLLPVKLDAPVSQILPSDELVLRFKAQPGTTAHDVEVIGPGSSTISDRFYENKDHCYDGLCTVYVPYSGTPGTYEVNIQAIAGQVYGPEGSSSFAVANGSLNPVMLTSPIGEVMTSDDLMLTFDAQYGTTAHRVKVTSDGFGLVFDQIVDTNYCSGETCQIAVSYWGTLGLYEVEITPYAGTTAGPTNTSQFNVIDLVMNPVVLTAPIGEAFVGAYHTLRFEAQPGTTSHQIALFSYATGLVSAQRVDTRDCSGGECVVVIPANGATGTFDAWIQPFVDGVGGPVKNTLFTVVDTELSPVVLETPSGTIPSGEVLPISFNAQSGTTIHRVEVFGPNAAIAVQEISTKDCAGSLCTLDVPYDGTPGNYFVWIRPSTGTLVGPWNYNPFVVNNDAPQMANLLSPTGTIPVSNRLALKFEAQPGTTSHNVVLNGPGGEIYNQFIDTRDCAGYICTVLVPYDGTTGNYDWVVTPYNGTQSGNFDFRNFTVADVALTPVKLLRPTDTIFSSDRLVLQWEAQAGTTAHHIGVFSSTSVLFANVVDTLDCAGGICTQVVPYNGALDTYTVWILPMISSTNVGTWEQTSFNVIDNAGLQTVSLTSPVGSVSLSNPVDLTFEAAGGTTAHRINVYNPLGLVLSQLVDTQDCSGSTCTVSVPSNNVAGAYSIWIRPYAGSVAGPWGGSNFTLNAPADLAAAAADEEVGAASATETPVTPDLVFDYVTLTSVCDGTWEIANPLSESVTLEWTAYSSVDDMQTGTITVGSNEIETLYTAFDTTGVLLEIEDSTARLYTEASGTSCEEF